MKFSWSIGFKWLLLKSFARFPPFSYPLPLQTLPPYQAFSAAKRPPKYALLVLCAPSQVHHLLKELQNQPDLDLTYIFISHDLSVVKFMSDRIMVMNKGAIEEIGAAETIYRQPQQDYTRQLISAIPTGSLERIQARQFQRGLSASWSKR